MTDAPYEPMAPSSTDPAGGGDAAASPQGLYALLGPPPRRTRGSIVAAVGLALVIVAAGAGIGWLWAELAPRVAVIKADQGYLYADSEPEQAMAGDGWFAILGAVGGLLFAVAAWYVLRRYRGPLLLVGLTVGSLVGAAVAWWVGARIGQAQFTLAGQGAALGARLDAPLGLRITNLRRSDLWTNVPNGVAAVQALVAAATYSVFAGFSAYPDLRGDPVPVYPGHPAYQDQSAYQDRPAYQDQSAYQDRPAYQDQSAYQVGPDPDPVGTPEPDQFGPGFAGNSDNATGTART